MKNCPKCKHPHFWDDKHTHRRICTRYVDSLKAECGCSGVDVPYLLDRLAAVEAERDAALARVAELEKDAARLDWLEVHGDYLEKNGYGADDRLWQLAAFDASLRVENTNLRDTIDEARNKK